MSSETNDARKDPAWKYAVRDVTNSYIFTCNFCSQAVKGGVNRLKKHLAGGYKDVKDCPNCPGPVRQEIQEYMKKKKQLKEQINTVIDIDEMMGDEDDEIDLDTNEQPMSSYQGSSSIGNKGKQPMKKKPKTKGALDTYFTPDPELVVERRKKSGKQLKIDENNPHKKELAKRAHRCIARFIYDTGIPLVVVENSSFAPMLQAIGDYGPDLPPPSYYQVRVPLLKEEKSHVHKMMQDHVIARETNGCTLMCDGWTDRRGRTLINFLVNCPRGSLFIDSIDASSYAKDAKKLFELLDEKVEEIGEANVVQIVTDSAAANKLAGKYLEAKRPHLFWTPCDAHICSDWWASFGSETPDLMHFAIKILSLTCSSSGCERNWSVFEHIHSKKRGNTLHTRLNDLVFVKYNRTLQRRYMMRKTIDPIAVSEIDESNEWLVGIPEEERVFDDDDLRWDDVAEAAGVEEPDRTTRKTYSRRTTSKSSNASTSRSSALGLVDEEEDEWQDVGGRSDDGEEQDVEGYVSDDNLQFDLGTNDD